jgi:DNA polymerase elongation subunit (family B)
LRNWLHEDVLALDYDNEYANLIVNHNLSYETVGCSGEARIKQLCSIFSNRLAICSQSYIERSSLIHQHMKLITITLAVVAIIALGTAGLISMISSMTEAHAISCQQLKGKDVCHGCAPKRQGFFSSDGTCSHHEP